MTTKAASLTLMPTPSALPNAKAAGMFKHQILTSFSLNLFISGCFIAQNAMVAPDRLTEYLLGGVRL